MAVYWPLVVHKTWMWQCWTELSPLVISHVPLNITLSHLSLYFTRCYIDRQYHTLSKSPQTTEIKQHGKHDHLKRTKKIIILPVDKVHIVTNTYENINGGPCFTPSGVGMVVFGGESYHCKQQRDGERAFSRHRPQCSQSFPLASHEINTRTHTKKKKGRKEVRCYS